MTSSGSSLNAPGSEQRADLVGTPSILGGIGRGNAYFDPEAFRPVTEARFGTAPWNVLYGPRFWSWDFGMFRELQIVNDTKEVVSVRSGKESGSVDAILNWLTPDGKPLLTETLRMTFHAHPELRIIDFEVDFAAIDKVVFRDTKEGTFAMRMATVLEEQPPKEKAGAPSRTGTLLNAQGGEGEANVWGKRSEWVDYSGQIDGEKVGVVIMDHPGNPRHPTYWHSRGTGCTRSIRSA